jgi:uncharacterized membrane protein
MDLEIFVGRFHPLIVHFPIALLAVATIMEVLSRFQKLKRFSSGLPVVLVLGAITALLSVLMGFFISGDRGYDDTILSWHKWTGVSVLLLSSFMSLVALNIIRVSPGIRTSLFVALFLLVATAGHFGGSLTHGDNYLSEKAPAFVRNLFIKGDTTNGVFSKLPQDPDSVIVFADMIAPLLTDRCTPCHNQTQKKGNLVLTSREGIEAGGDGGPAIRAGKAMESLLFTRISLPQDHEKFMPLKEEPLSFAEVNLIAWWINQGASFEAPLSEFSTIEIKDLLIRDFKFNPVSRSYFETVQIPPADSLEIEKLRLAGFIITPLAQNNHFLSVSLPNGAMEVSLESLNQLLAIKDNITWLDLAQKQISDDHLLVVAQLGSLTRLNLNGNPITGKNFSALAQLKSLESINLYDTQVGDEALMSRSELPSLKRVYLWNTKVTGEGMAELKKLRPRVEIDTGSMPAVQLQD